MEARYQDLSCFVVYKNGDTIKGKELTTKHNRWSGKDTWRMDEKEISSKNVSVFQDQYGYYIEGSNFIKMYTGKIELYGIQTDNTKIGSYYSQSSGKLGPVSSGSVSTQFYMKKGDWFTMPTYKEIMRLVQDNPAALAQFHQEFPSGKKPNNVLNDYRAILRILKVYDSQ